MILLALSLLARYPNQYKKTYAKEFIMNRRQFLQKTTSAVLTAGLSGCTLQNKVFASNENNKFPWAIEPKKWPSLGPQDLHHQLDAGMQWANKSLIENGTVEPPNGGLHGRSMRSACMPAQACAFYYTMTQDPTTLKALKAAVKTFRKYKRIARGQRIPYEDLSDSLIKKYAAMSDEKPTIEYEVIACHVGRNMKGIRAAAHILKDKKLLDQAAQELNFWIDNPLGFNPDINFFDARIFLDPDGKTIGSEKRFTVNMAGSLASSMWLIGNDLGDKRMMQYAEDQILKGIPPLQLPNGYFPYNIGHKVELKNDIAVNSNYYHSLTLQVLSPLLAYEFWQNQPKFVEMMRRGAKYVRDKLTDESGVIQHPAWMDEYRASKGYGKKGPFGITADSALVHTRLYKYLGDEEAFTQAAKNLRWFHHNPPALFPFFSTDSHFAPLKTIGEWGFSHCFRQVVLTAAEGMHLKKKGENDVEAVFIA
jgi:hypothetical protein